VSELESERWIGESGLTATNVIGPQHLGPTVGSGGLRWRARRSASTDFPNTSLAHSAQTTLSTTPQPLPRDFSCAERVRETRTGAHHQPAYASMRKRETPEPASCQSQQIFFSCCCLDELAVRGCLLRLNMAYHSRRTARTRRSSPVNRWFYCFVPSTRKNRPVEVSVGRWQDAALPRVSMSPPHARAAKPWKGSSLVRQSRGYRPEHRKSGESSHFPGTQAYWTVRQLLAGRANVFCESRL
jgi:hypothetical protein